MQCTSPPHHTPVPSLHLTLLHLSLLSSISLSLSLFPSLPTASSFLPSFLTSVLPSAFSLGLPTSLLYQSSGLISSALPCWASSAQAT